MRRPFVCQCPRGGVRHCFVVGKRMVAAVVDYVAIPVGLGLKSAVGDSSRFGRSGDQKLATVLVLGDLEVRSWRSGDQKLATVLGLGDLEV